MLKHLRKFNLTGIISAFALLSCSVSANAKTYEKVTSALTDYSGEYLIVCETGPIALDGKKESTSIASTGNSVVVTILNNAITQADGYYVTIAPSNTAGKYTIKAASGYYIGGTKGSNGIQSSKTTPYDNTITISNGEAIIVSNETTLKYNGNVGQTRFSYVTSTTTGTLVKGISLYKLKAAPSISPNATSIDMGTTAINNKRTTTANVTVANLPENISVSISGSNANMFSASVNEQTANTCVLNIAYTPTQAGTHTATITLKSGSATATINVTGKATNPADGSGTESDPYTVEYLSKLTTIQAGIHWVKGTIAGYYNNGKADKDNLQDNNLALQNAGSDAVIRVQLTSELQSEFGVKSHPENIGRVVLIKGTLTPTAGIVGITNPTEIKFTTDKFSISSSKWATYYTDKAFIMPANATGYIVLPNGSSSNTVSPEKTYTEGDIVPAKTPIIVNGEAGDYTYYTTTTTKTSDTRNMLRGQLKAGMITPEASGSYLYYKLSYNSDGEALGFYWGAENGGVFSLKGNNRAYLVVPQSTNSAKSIRVIMPGDETTGINNISGTNENDVATYNLAGQRVGIVAKGIYIKNGKKFLVR